jgi:hypothetical protein
LSAGNYVILTKAGISTVPDSVITGDIAVSPIAATAMTGFSLTADPSNEYSTSVQVTGQAFAADYGVPTPAVLTSAVGAMEAAYTDAAGRPNDDNDRVDLGTGILGGDFGGAGHELTPGVYTFGSRVVIGSQIVFKGNNANDGDPPDVFIIQITGTLTVKHFADTSMILQGGALAKNIFWQVAEAVAVEETAHVEGILLAKTSVVFKTGSSLNGRILAQTHCTLDQATIDGRPLEAVL